MTGKSSAGIVLYRILGAEPGAPGGPPVLQVLLGHLGGPFWSRKDAGAWTVPKGELDPDEDPQAAARREFAEETGHALGPQELLPLGSIRQSAGKTVLAWAALGDLDPATATSNTVQVEWPPRSGRQLTVPELDRVAWFDLAHARRVCIKAQAELLDRLLDALRDRWPQLSAGTDPTAAAATGALPPDAPPGATPP